MTLYILLIAGALILFAALIAGGLASSGANRRDGDE